MIAPIQVTKQLPLFRSWGGARANAGRKPGGRRTVAHRTRPVHRARNPLHVTLRARAGLPPFRETVLADAIRDAIREASRSPSIGPAFRVVHFSIQTNHLHLIVEAHDARTLTRAMKGLAVRVARAVNRALGVRGRVFRERYHARELGSPRAVRNAIVYVLMNAAKHGIRLTSGIDACSSAPWFDGFAARPPTSRDDPPVRAPRTWLAAIGWRRRGLIRTGERPRAPD